MPSSILFDGFILLTLIFLFVVSLGYPFEVKLLPLIFIPLAIILLSAQIIIDILQRKKEEPIGKEEPFKIKIVSKLRGINNKYLKTVLAVVVLFICLYLFGFMIAAPAFTIFMLRSNGESWRTSVGLSVFFWVIFFSIFMYALEVQIYKGMIYLILFD